MGIVFFGGGSARLFLTLIVVMVHNYECSKNFNSIL